MERIRISKLESPDDREPALETYIEKVNKEILDPLKSNAERRNPNISKEERGCLENLKNNRAIVIKPADKWGCIVIMNREVYESEIKEMLKGGDFYDKKEKDMNPEFAIDWKK